MKRANDSQAGSLAGSIAVNVNHTGLGLKKNKKKGSRENLFTDPSGNPLPKELLNSVTLFQRKQKKGIIDVWWLYDDGGSCLAIKKEKKGKMILKFDTLYRSYSVVALHSNNPPQLEFMQTASLLSG